MDPDRWKRIEALFHEALEKPAGERGGFLDAACGPDAGLRSEVETLLRRDAVHDVLEEPIPVTPGTRLGGYEILSPLGRGGMGEVWRARDTRLGREVAIKTLPEAFARDAERLARFEREARLLASLNHPNIAVIHGLEESEGVRFLVLELIEGPTLDERLEAGALSVASALGIGVQIAEALEAAHARGVIHRDLKPGNIKVTPEDTVKVLDFGLAKAVADPGADLSHAPTRSETMTREGTIQGTPAYMSPEQVRGEPVDAQTDVWAFGCVLFQMLSGRSPFGQGALTETLAKVLEREPEFDALPNETPPLVARLIRRCLAKDVRKRLHSIADARTELDEALVTGRGSVSAPALPRARWASSVGLAALIVAAGFTGWLVAVRSAPDAAPVASFAAGPSVVAPTGAPFGDRVVAVSPDGARLAYASGAAIWLQTLGRMDASPIAIGHDPFFSPDGEWVAFWGETLDKVSVQGGDPVSVVSVPGGRYTGGTWHGETIVFATQAGLYSARVDQGGGGADLLLAAPEGQTYAWPEFLPGGDYVLLTVLTGNSVGAAHLVLLDLESGTLSDPLVRGAVGARYVPGSDDSGYLVYATQGGSLTARTFDPDTGTVGSTPSEVPDVEVRITGSYLAAAFATSDTGTLVHVPPSPGVESRFVWLDHDGTEEVVNAALPGGGINYPRISPEGDRVTFDVGTGTPGRRIWMMDLDRGVPTQLSDDSTDSYEDMQGIWSRDGARVYFGSLRTDAFEIWSHAGDGSGSDEQVTEDPDVIMPLAATPAGRLVVMLGGYGVADIGVLDPENPAAVQRLIETPSSQVTPTLSPDGNWIAYASNESGGRYEIYVQSFPSGGVKERVSRNGGANPLWGLEGSGELYFTGLNDSGSPAMMAARVDTEPQFRVLDVRELIPNRNYLGWSGQAGGLRPYDISPKDGRFFVIRTELQPGSLVMTLWVTLNWARGLKTLLHVP